MKEAQRRLSEADGEADRPVRAGFLDRLEHAFVAVNSWMLLVLLAVMSVLVFANVTLRYTTNLSITWAEEVARYAMIWLTFLGSGLVLRLGGHVAITNLPDTLPPTAARVMRGTVAAILLVFFCVMIWMGWEYMTRMRFQATPATQISFSYVYAAIPVGFVLMAVHLLLILRQFIADDKPVDAEHTAERRAAGG